MPSFFHIGWAALLALLALGMLSRREHAGGRLGTAWQVALAAGVIVWGGHVLATIAGDHGPGLEVERIVLRPTAPGAALVLGSDSAHADVTLQDPSTAGVHAVLSWEEGAGDPVPTLRNVSATHRLEVDGIGLHDSELRARTEITVGRRTLEVAAPGLWPGLLLVDDRGQVTRLRAPLARGVMAMLPLIGGRVTSTLAWVQPDGDGVRVLDHPPLPGTGPVAILRTRGRTPYLAFATPADRAEHPVLVDPPGASVARPADRAHPLRTGEVLTLGRSRWAVSVARGGEVTLSAVGARTRVPWPSDEGTVLDGVGAVLLAGHPDELTLTVASLTERRGFRRLAGLPTLGDGGDPRITLHPGDRVALEVAPGVTSQLRLAARAEPTVALAGFASAQDASLWTLLAVLAALYLAATVTGARLGYLHGRTGGVLHGSALLIVVGLACLYRLSDPGNPMQAGWALHQARILTLGVGAGAAFLLGLSILARLRSRRGLRPLRGDALFHWLEGPEADGRRARWLYWVAVAVLLAQQPFGEAGIALPGVGSVQPIELARTLLVVYLAFWTARALEAKRRSLRGAEGLAARWAYMAHALPILVVLVLCYALHDISPILVFSVFLAGFYALSLMRPSLRLFPLRNLREHLAVDVVAVALVLGVAGWLLLGDPGGTVARRIAVWWDPWTQTGEAYQAMTALWATASGGLWGAGWEGANGVLPPAVRDDFILALLAARGGAAAVTLVAATFAVILLSGAAGIAHGRASGALGERRALLAGGMLWMLAIQAGVVLGSATGGLPVMGQPLPLVAAAGSHLLFFCLPAIATVLACTRLPHAAPARVRPRSVTPWPAVAPVDLPAPALGVAPAPALGVAPAPALAEPPSDLPTLPLGPLSHTPITLGGATSTHGPVTEGAG